MHQPDTHPLISNILRKCLMLFKHIFVMRISLYASVKEHVPLHYATFIF